MNMIADLWQGCHRLDQPGRKILGVRCHKADAFNALHSAYAAKKLWKIHPVIRIGIGVNVLSKQRNFPETTLRK